MLPDHSFKVQSTLAAYRIVSPVSSTADTVEYPPTIGAAAPFFGVTMNEVKDTTSSIPVRLSGVARVFFNDTVTSGKLVTADTSGRGVPYTAATVAGWFIGTLIGPSVSSTGTIAEVLVNPGLGSAG